MVKNYTAGVVAEGDWTIDDDRARSLGPTGRGGLAAEKVRGVEMREPPTPRIQNCSVGTPSRAERCDDVTITVAVDHVAALHSNALASRVDVDTAQTAAEEIETIACRVDGHLVQGADGTDVDVLHPELTIADDIE